MKSCSRLSRFIKTGLIALGLLMLLLLTSTKTVLGLENKFTDIFCMQPPYEQLCSILPHDQTDFSAQFVYMLIEKGAQDPFDMFSWQSFVALNWPANAQGQTQSHPIGTRPQATRVWQYYDELQTVFHMNDANEPCSTIYDNNDKVTVLVQELIQASGHALIDSNLNFVVYDTRINPVAATYIKTNELDTRAGQEKFLATGDPIDFPMGYFEDNSSNNGGQPPSISIKTAWMIMDKNIRDASSRYYIVNGLISITAERSATGEAQCIETKLGLIGMHIVQRTRSGHGNEWIWSTFEHIDNAPTASNTRGINSIYDHDLFPGGCQAPVTSETKRYNLFNAACKDCETNNIKTTDWKWAERPPYAQSYAVQDQYGTQAVRCWDIFESTAAVNNLWHEKLTGTVWENYQLISTQWRGANKGVLFENGEVPRFLTNTSMETFVQYRKDGSCMSCHVDAKTAAGQNANFSFLLRNAH